MNKIRVELYEKSYEIRLGASLLEQAGGFLAEKGFSGRAIIITDSTVEKLYGGLLQKTLAQAGFETSLFSVPAGEAQKSLETAGILYGKMAEAHAERNTPVLALGGGVIGDLAGFVAATYMRGVPLVQVPTTLLAQVDSSIGGKAAVDHGQLKNMIGAFYQPKMVISDISTLQTLPEAELANGMAEVIKSAAIRSESLFEYLEKKVSTVLPDTQILGEVVLQTASIKAEVVAKDEKDQGLRNILNFGHTIGHAVETVSSFSLKHGQAVAIGMVVAARISKRLGMLKQADAARLERVISGAGLPVKMPELDINNIIEALQHDKKISWGKLRFILLKAIGEAVISDDVSLSLVREALNA